MQEKENIKNQDSIELENIESPKNVNLENIKSRKIIELGSRKTASATVRLGNQGTNVIVNGKSISDYLLDQRLIDNALKPFKILEISFDANISVKGSGLSAQSGAIRYAISKALASLSIEFKDKLKKLKLLAGDPRRVLRKLVGHYKSRKKYPYRKR